MARPPMFRTATVIRIVKETPDTRTFVLEPHDGPFSYQAGQFCTFKVNVEGKTLFRSYSMSSAPEVDTEFMTTVKRVPGGQVSNWMHDNLSEGDVVELTVPTGRFCLRESAAPMLGFAGGSGITPIFSLAKSTLATTDRSVRLLCADRDRTSAISDVALDDLVRRYPDRLTVVRHLDDVDGYVDAAKVREFVGEHTAGDAYICGPEPYMELVENALSGPGRIFSERFGSAPAAAPAPAATSPASTATPVESASATTDATPTAPAAATAAASTEPGEVTIFLNRKRVTVERKPDETLLESARRAGLTPPFSCESGSCATCMAKVTKGSATMRVNDALADDEIEEGWVLTCQAVPDTPSITVKYE